MSTPIEETLTKVAGAVIELRARCDALHATLRAIAAKAGVEPERVDKALRTTTQLRYQQLLEQVETLDPELAAHLDTREDIPDLPDVNL